MKFIQEISTASTHTLQVYAFISDLKNLCSVIRQKKRTTHI